MYMYHRWHTFFLFLFSSFSGSGSDGEDDDDDDESKNKEILQSTFQHPLQTAVFSQYSSQDCSYPCKLFLHRLSVRVHLVK